MTKESIQGSQAPYREDERFALLDQVMARFDHEEHGLVEVLIAVQDVFGHLPQEALIYVSEELHVPLSRVYGVATFYDTFTLKGTAATNCKICTGPVCEIAGAKELLQRTRDHVALSEEEDTTSDRRYRVDRVSCLGLCDHAPAALINDKAQVNLSPQDISQMLRGEADLPGLKVSGEPRRLTAPIGRLDPLDLEAHRGEGAFAALEKALDTMAPEDVIEEVKASRLTGRGGAGFPTGLKWEFARQADGSRKFVVCNFDEAEPGTFKDRLLMEGNPFRVIEGLIICAYAVGSKRGYIYIRAEYAAASQIVESALSELRSAGLLGENILGSDFSFDVEIRHNAGAYICGEETALFESIEGKRGHPRLKPPYPTQRGLFDKPTAINNVETLAVVPDLVLHGGGWFHQWGTENSTGLKLLCLSGHVGRPGVVEVAYGLPIREVVERFAGGFHGEPKAILMGGAAGGFLHSDWLDTPLTHEDLGKLDVPIGSGAMMVFNQSVDVWKVLQGLAEFFVHETCGRCAPCRLGTKQILTLVRKINSNAGSPEDIGKLKVLGQRIKSSSVCGLGLTAANPALTFLNHFEGVS